MLEALAIDLGMAVAKAALKVWLRDPVIARGTGADMGEILAKKLPLIPAHRSAKRSFEGMADAVAESVRPYLESEFGGLPDNEKRAAVMAIIEGLNAAKFDDKSLFSADLDPLVVEKLLLKVGKEPLKAAYLSEAGDSFYHRLIRESATYITVIATNLPQFGPKADVEILKRESELLALMHAVLNRLPQDATAEFGDVEDFETRYRREIIRQFDRLELFGLTAESSRHYQLSVAYITLSATPTATAHSRLREAARREKHKTIAQSEAALPKPDESELYVHVDQALEGAKRVLIRGEAGSGKTTLLQHLACSSARRDFKGPLRGWNDTVPLFLQLRRYSDGELPPPERFLDKVAPQLGGIMPKGWVHHLLLEGRALILIDGVDEIPSRHRQKVKQWLAGLRQAFPNTTFIITSRPPAVSDDWLSEEDFESTELQPMGIPDITAFIEHWHEAAGASMYDASEQAVLVSLQTKLQTLVRTNAAIRNLATSPLLCAMLCALNRDRKSQLPKERPELYRIAMEMLLERRDIEREIEIDGNVLLTLPEKEVLLRDLAYWLMRNSAIDMEVPGAENQIKRKLREMPHVHSDAKETFGFLLERSGLLRQPVPGRVDFVHRTFQEYLAAGQVVEEDDIGFLVQHAHEDQWREVIILTPSLARKKQRVALISGLLKRGNEESSNRHLLHLLAVACLETSQELPANLTKELTDCLGRLIPPTNMTDAKALSSAGELAVPLLAAHRKERVAIATACIRTLSLIGGEQSLETLSRFANDQRATVSRELLRGWRSFDPDRYSEVVLARSPRLTELQLDDLELLPGVRNLALLRKLVLDGVRRGKRARAVDLRPLRDLKRLRVLAIQAIGRVEHFDALSNLRLEQLAIVGCDSGINTETLGRLPGLRQLGLEFLPEIGDLRPLKRLRQLNSVTLRRLSALEDISPICGPPLQTLHVINCPDVADISAVGRSKALTALRIVGADKVEALDALAKLGQLQELMLSGFTAIEELPPLKRAESLRSIVITGCTNLSNVSALSGLRNCVNLSLANCGALQHLAGIDSLEALMALHLGGTAIDDLGPLTSLSGLRELNLSFCKGIVNLTPLERLRRLRSLTLIGCGDLEDLRPLAGCSGLQYLDLERCVGLSDVSSLEGLRQLQFIDATGCDPDLDFSRLEARGVRVVGRPLNALRAPLSKPGRRIVLSSTRR